MPLLIYAFNQLDRRKELWNKIEDIGRNLNGPWIVIGDFNNVLAYQDRIGGNHVVEDEFRDLKNMMSNMGLFEADMKGNLTGHVITPFLAFGMLRNLTDCVTMLPFDFWHVTEHHLLCNDRGQVPLSGQAKVVCHQTTVPGQN